MTVNEKNKNKIKQNKTLKQREIGENWNCKQYIQTHMIRLPREFSTWSHSMWPDSGVGSNFIFPFFFLFFSQIVHPSILIPQPSPKHIKKVHLIRFFQWLQIWMPLPDIKSVNNLQLQPQLPARFNEYFFFWYVIVSCVESLLLTWRRDSTGGSYMHDINSIRRKLYA